MFNRFKHSLLRLSSEEKVTGIGGLLILIGCFMPWYSVVFNFDQKNITETGFSGDLGVIGFVVFMLTVLGLLYLVGEHLGVKLPTFGHAKERIILFLTGESAFMLLLSIAIYTKRSFDYTSAELRFGLYTALIGACLGTFAAYAEGQKREKKEVEEFFDHPEDMMEEIMDREEVIEHKPARAKKTRTEPVIEESVIEESMPEENLAAQEFFVEAEPEILREIAEEEAEPAMEPEMPAAPVQGNFFAREAGIRVSEPKVEEKKEESPSLSMNFYEDNL